MAKSAIKYRKRVYNAVKGFSACKYTVCKQCPYHSQGCKDKLYDEAADLLADYFHLLKEQAENAAAKAGNDKAAFAAAPLV